MGCLRGFVHQCVVKKDALKIAFRTKLMTNNDVESQALNRKDSFESNKNIYMKKGNVLEQITTLKITQAYRANYYNSERLLFELP